MNSLIVAFVLCFTIVHPIPIKNGKDINLQNYFQVCKRDLSFNDCLKTTLQESLPKLAKGIPELGLQALDPFVEPEILLDFKQNQIQGRAVMRNVRTYGFSSVQIKDVRSEISDNDLNIEVDVAIPRIDIEGNFKGEGTFADAFVLNTKGYFNMSMSGVTTTWQISGEKETIDNEDYMKIKHFKMTPTVEKMKVYMSELFPGNEELNQATNIFLNENWRNIYKELLPYAEAYWDPAMTRAANQIFLNVPYKYLLEKP